MAGKQVRPPHTITSSEALVGSASPQQSGSYEESLKTHFKRTCLSTSHNAGDPCPIFWWDDTDHVAPSPEQTRKSRNVSLASLGGGTASKLLSVFSSGDKSDSQPCREGRYHSGCWTQLPSSTSLIWGRWTVRFLPQRPTWTPITQPLRCPVPV